MPNCRKLLFEKVNRPTEPDALAAKKPVPFVLIAEVSGNRGTDNVAQNLFCANIASTTAGGDAQERKTSLEISAELGL